MDKALEKRLSEFLFSRGWMAVPSDNADGRNGSGKPWLKLWSFVNVDPAECDLDGDPDWWYRSFDAIAFGDLNVMPPWPSLFNIERERFRDFAPSSEEELDIMLTARGL